MIRSTSFRPTVTIASIGNNHRYDMIFRVKRARLGERDGLKGQGGEKRWAYQSEERHGREDGIAQKV